MTQVQFIQEIITAYNKARLFSVPCKSGRIRRCRSHTVSSFAEDIFASYVLDLVNSNYSIFVDCPVSISAPKGGKPITYYPDIVVYEEKGGVCEIKYLIDLKMDAGWFRSGIVQMVKDHDKVVKAFNDAKCITMSGCNSVKFVQNLRYDIVICSPLNGGKNYCCNVTTANNLGLCSCVYTLTDGVHPNALGANANTSGINKNDVYPFCCSVIPNFAVFDQYCKRL